MLRSFVNISNRAEIDLVSISHYTSREIMAKLTNILENKITPNALRLFALCRPYVYPERIHFAPCTSAIKITICRKYDKKSHSVLQLSGKNKLPAYTLYRKITATGTKILVVRIRNRRSRRSSSSSPLALSLTLSKHLTLSRNRSRKILSSLKAI